MPQILYVSTLCSERFNNYLFETALKKPIQSAQKFHRLIVKGITANNEVQISALSAIPVMPSRHKRLLWIIPNEIENGIRYSYLPLINIRVLKNIVLFFGCFLKVFFWCIARIGRKRVLITDVLNITNTAAAIIACKLTATKIIGIVTDMPGISVVNNSSFKTRFFSSINLFFIERLSAFILLTQQMNNVINRKKRPYIIMEGLVDIDMNTSKNVLEKKSKESIILYAGGLFEKYGIKKLIEGFKKLPNNNICLHLYGVGPMVDEIIAYSKKDSRIVYKGMVANREVVEAQLRAILLVNPRSSKEEFTKYSFPSKNMEYMASGTPVLTTPLPGMPEEYKSFVYLLEDETENGVFNKLKLLLDLGREELHNYGTKAKKFVLTEKNNLKQSTRIIELTKIVLN